MPRIDPFYLIPIVLALFVSIFYIINHNKKVKVGQTPRETAKTNKNANRRSRIEKIEENLIKADVGTSKTAEIIKALKSKGEEEFESVLESFLPPNPNQFLETAKSPKTVIFVGVNGVGKTTTIGKLAFNFSKNGESVVLGAADTFRAAAADQFETWANRSSKNSGVVKIVRNDGVDPAAVAFDAAKEAVTSKADYLFIDTAGRMQNNSNLLDELKKIVRSVEKNTDVDEIVLILDGTVGQNALEQANKFKDAVSLTGLIITKLDGSAKGGVILKLTDELNLPVRFVGIGEGIEDLKEFNAKEFLEVISR